MLKALYISVLTIMITACQSTSQKPQRIDFQSEDGKEDYYMELKPKEGKINGVLVLMPGFSQRAEDVYADSDLPDLAIENNLLVVTIGTGFNLCANESVVQRLNEILTDVLIKHDFGQEQFVFGGFSAGGSILMRYAEYCHETPGDFPVVPAAVFSVDAPLDVISFFTYCEREIARNYSEVGMNEARHVKKMLENKYGSLEDHRDVYEKLTSINIENMDPGNEQHLYRIPVRVYHDVDINWILSERRRSAMDANFLAGSELISRLLLMNNLRAEFIQSEIKGMRKDGRRHPHSWNIVDGPECISWANKAMGVEK